MPLLSKLALPAVELFENTIVPFPEASTAVTKLCVAAELFVIPVPLTVRVEPGVTVMVCGFVAAVVNTMALTSVFAEIERSVVFEAPNVAVSADPLGTVAGLKFVTVFQSPEAGLRSHIALPAWAKLAM